MIPELKNLTYSNRLKRLNSWTLEDKRKRADLVEVYKITCRLSAVDFDKFFTRDSGTRTRGHSWN